MNREGVERHSTPLFLVRDVLQLYIFKSRFRYLVFELNARAELYTVPMDKRCAQYQ